MVKRNIKVKFIKKSEKFNIGEEAFMSMDDAKAYQKHGIVEILDNIEDKKLTHHQENQKYLIDARINAHKITLMGNVIVEYFNNNEDSNINKKFIDTHKIIKEKYDDIDPTNYELKYKINKETFEYLNLDWNKVDVLLNEEIKKFNDTQYKNISEATTSLKDLSFEIQLQEINVIFENCINKSPIELKKIYEGIKEQTGWSITDIKNQHDYFISKKKQQINENLKIIEKQEKFDIASQSFKVDLKNFYSVSHQAIQLLMIKNIDSATELIVDYIKFNNNIYTIRSDIDQEVFIYCEGIYVPDGKSYIKEIVRQLLGKGFNQFISAQVISKISTDTYIDSQLFFSAENKNEIALNNGIFNLNTKKLSEFTPQKIFFSKMNVKYNSSAKCKNILKFFNDVLENEGDILLIQEMFGWFLKHDYKHQKAFMFNGKGRNGKGITLNLIQRFIGEKNCCEIGLDKLEQDKYCLAEFFNKWANLAGDIPNRAIKCSDLFKKLTGYDLISATRKFIQKSLDFRSFAKWVLACNELPMTYDTTDGFMDRWIFIDFPYKFTTQKEINNNKENKYLKLRDTEIIEKISSEEEMSGLLNWSLEGLDRLNKNNGFSQNNTTNDVRTMWIRRSNSFGAFCMDLLDFNKFEDEISKNDLRKEYSKYCRKFKLKSVSDAIIKKTLTEDYGCGEKQIKSTGARVWDGIGWKDKKMNFYNVFCEQIKKNSDKSVISYNEVRVLFPETDEDEINKSFQKAIDEKLIIKNNENYLILI